MPATNKNGMSATIGDSAPDVKSEIARQTCQPCRSSRTLTKSHQSLFTSTTPPSPFSPKTLLLPLLIPPSTLMRISQMNWTYYNLNRFGVENPLTNETNTVETCTTSSYTRSDLVPNQISNCPSIKPHKLRKGIPHF